MNYQLWDLVSGNLLGVYPTEAEALAWVRQYLDDEGAEYVQDLALDGPDAQGQRHMIAKGEELARLALAQTPTA